MYLSNIKLWNFRKFGTDGELDLTNPNLNLNFTKGLNVIVGENDSGKTAIIDAIKLVLKTHSYEYLRVEDKDFFQDSNRFRIQLIFKGLTTQEAKNFTEWLAWEDLEDNIEPYLQLNYDVKKSNNRILPADIKAGVDEEGYLLTSEAKEYLKITYLKPLRDAENELIAKKNSRLSQILLGDPAFKGKENDHELVTIFNRLSTDLDNYFKGEFVTHRDDEQGARQEHKPQEGKAIKNKIDGYIQDFYNDTHQTLFSSTTNNIKNILEKLSLYLENQINPGLGTLNRLFMAAELLHLNKSNWTGLRLGLIEELEAHLHPQAQMQMIEAFQKQKDIQLILSTHSPNLASKLSLENLIVCNNGNAFPMGKGLTKLNPVNYKFLEKFLDTTKANLFFAKGVIFVEGWAEEILLPSLAKLIGYDLTKHGVSVVNVGNIGFEHYSKIFIRNNSPYMTVPISVITDSDIREYIKNGEDLQLRDQNTVSRETTAKIAEISRKNEQSVEYFVAPTWTLEYALFKSTSLSVLFQSIVKAIHTGTDWDRDFQKELAQKLINRGLSKTEIAYQMADAIDQDLLLEEDQRIIRIDLNNVNDTINYLIQAIKYATGNRNN
ncbi:ATP-dependent nuclease [Myroides injenensis]|uniref:ATP-dependent nuclease n=1 Tax=Myroides injenensis TaxID=1183151 RepID=UPI00028962B8|nr:AAA family ATPase [Myroides injenensis]